MIAQKGVPTENSRNQSGQRSQTGYPRIIAISAGIAVGVALIGYSLWGDQRPSVRLFPPGSATVKTETGLPDPSPKSPEPEVHLTREGIDLLLDALDQAIRRKDIDGVLRHIAPDATIIIHMKQGAQQQQIAPLSREEYRKILAMRFALPSANDFARVHTTVSLAPDTRSAKVAFKSTETLRQAHREITIEGDETLVFTVRGHKPLITFLEQIVPGDST